MAPLSCRAEPSLTDATTVFSSRVAGPLPTADCTHEPMPEASPWPSCSVKPSEHRAAFGWSAWRHQREHVDAAVVGRDARHGLPEEVHGADAVTRQVAAVGGRYGVGRLEVEAVLGDGPWQWLCVAAKREACQARPLAPSLLRVLIRPPTTAMTGLPEVASGPTAGARSAK
jgi:hypothetical protein